VGLGCDVPRHRWHEDRQRWALDRKIRHCRRQSHADNANRLKPVAAGFEGFAGFAGGASKKN
jgi:hypothetical protein